MVADAEGPSAPSVQADPGPPPHAHFDGHANCFIESVDDAIPLKAEGESFLLVLSPPPTPVYDAYRLEIVDVSATPAKTLWSSEKLARRTDDIPILVRRSFFKSGKYRVVLYGVSGSQEERVSTYTLRVPGR